MTEYTTPRRSYQKTGRYVGLTKAAKQYPHIKLSTLQQRIHRGMTFEDAVAMPVRPKGRILTKVEADLLANPETTAGEMAERLGEYKQSIRNALIRLVDRGTVVRTSHVEPVRGVPTIVWRYRTVAP